jgi:PTH2 family peptidyl-tRNA hydrolase
LAHSDTINNTDFRFKQSIVVRVDLGMSKGKLASQVGHAAVSASEKARKNKLRWWNIWIKEGQMKVVLKVHSSTELESLYKKAKTLDLPCELIIDRGLTEIPPGTITCVGIGPAPVDKVDKVTGDLALL